jgi:hypothetical protein
MARFLYQLTFPVASASPNPTQTHVFVSQNRDIETWYIPFPGTYIFRSDRLLAELQSPFSQFFGQTLFLLTYLSPSLMTGSLPLNVWEWVNQPDTPMITG